MKKSMFINNSDNYFEWGRLLISRLPVITNKSTKTGALVSYAELSGCAQMRG